jgi:hypothetical protein
MLSNQFPSSAAFSYKIQRDSLRFFSHWGVLSIKYFYLLLVLAALCAGQWGPLILTLILGSGVGTSCRHYCRWSNARASDGSLSLPEEYYRFFENSFNERATEKRTIRDFMPVKSYEKRSSPRICTTKFLMIYFYESNN